MTDLENITVLTDDKAMHCHHSIVWITYNKNGKVKRLANRQIDSDSYPAKLRCGAGEFEITLLKWSHQALLLEDVDHGDFKIAEQRRVKFIAEELTLKKNEVLETSKNRLNTQKPVASTQLQENVLAQDRSAVIT